MFSVQYNRCGEVWHHQFTVQVVFAFLDSKLWLQKLHQEQLWIRLHQHTHNLTHDLRGNLRQISVSSQWKRGLDLSPTLMTDSGWLNSTACVDCCGWKLHRAHIKKKIWWNMETETEAMTPWNQFISQLRHQFDTWIDLQWNSIWTWQKIH